MLVTAQPQITSCCGLRGLGEDARAEIAGGQAQHLEIDARQAFLRHRHIFGDLVFLESRVGGDLTGLGRAAERETERTDFHEMLHRRSLGTWCAA